MKKLFLLLVISLAMLTGVAGKIQQNSSKSSDSITIIGALKNLIPDNI